MALYGCGGAQTPSLSALTSLVKEGQMATESRHEGQAEERKKRIESEEEMKKSSGEG